MKYARGVTDAFDLTSAKEHDEINAPKHYNAGDVYETIKVIEAWDLGFHLSQVLKYLSRAGKKPGESQLKDLEKARWYLNREIENLKSKK